MSYFGWKPYVPVAERRKKAEKAAAKAKKAGATLSPIAPYRGAIAKTFWGKSWCENLERYSDYANRLERGRTYVRNGSVIDLNIAEGQVNALVMGSSLYKVAVKILAVQSKQWQTISADCAGSIDSLIELLQGKLSTAVMQRICTPGTGLFPTPKEISFSCSCPDWASMCKHVAAVLYGVGARLDQSPELLFRLRQVDAKDLVSQAGTGIAASKRTPTTSKVLDRSMVADVFGIELDQAGAVEQKKPSTKPKASTAHPAQKRAKTEKKLTKNTANSTAKATTKSAAKSKTGAPVSLAKARKKSPTSTSSSKKIATTLRKIRKSVGD